MRHHLTEELISAYIDGELDAGEQQFVRQKLAESEEHQRLFEELNAQRDSLRGLPRFQLPEGFDQRVLGEIDRIRGAVTLPDDQQRTYETRAKRPRSRRWQAAGGGAAAIAVALLAAVLSNPWADDGEIPERGPSPPPADPFAARPEAAKESFVYYVPSAGDRPQYSLVVDLAVTPEGQDNQVFQDAFRRAGLPFDEELALGEDLEQQILDSRFLGNLLTREEDEDAAKVEVVYVVCESAKGNEIIMDLAGRRMAGEVAWLQLDMIANPRDLNMLYRVNQHSRQRFASVGSVKEKRSLVHRLMFSFTLRGASVGFLGRIPTPSLDLQDAEDKQQAETPAAPSFTPSTGAESSEQLSSEELSSEPLQETGQPSGAAELPTQAAPSSGNLEDEPTEILFVLRKL